MVRNTKIINISKDNPTTRTPTLDSYFKEVNKYALITADEERDLIVRFKLGDERAGEKVIHANLRFVISVAKQFISTGIPLPDLISSGNIGLLRALQKFDHTKGFKFISYAVWWVRQSIMQEVLINARMIRLPASVSQLNNQHRRETGSDLPNIAELAISPLEHARNDETNTYMDILSSDLYDSPDDLAFGNNLLSIAVGHLSSQEQNVIKMRYGIGLTQPYTYDEISNALGNGLSRERIRQIHLRAIRKLKLSVGKICVDTLI